MAKLTNGGIETRPSIRTTTLKRPLLPPLNEEAGAGGVLIRGRGICKSQSTGASGFEGEEEMEGKTKAETPY